ncbi:hypothetical protein [Parasphaerochaeta coccoides]|nr:hypothetical protein [Parasphaerochaeta coccoides]
MCCHEKVIYGDELIYDMDSACEFLDVLTNFCMVYPARFRKCPRCRKMTLWKAMMAAWLPESCAYVQWARRHHIRLASRLRLVIAEDGFCKAVLPDEDEGESENV